MPPRHTTLGVWHHWDLERRYDTCAEAEAWDDHGELNGDYFDMVFNDKDQCGGVILTETFKKQDGGHVGSDQRRWVACRGDTVVGVVVAITPDQENVNQHENSTGCSVVW